MTSHHSAAISQLRSCNQLVQEVSIQCYKKRSKTMCTHATGCENAILRVVLAVSGATEKVLLLVITFKGKWPLKDSCPQGCMVCDQEKALVNETDDLMDSNGLPTIHQHQACMLIMESDLAKKVTNDKNNSHSNCYPRRLYTGFITSGCQC